MPRTRLKAWVSGKNHTTAFSQSGKNEVGKNAPESSGIALFNKGRRTPGRPEAIIQETVRSPRNPMANDVSNPTAIVTPIPLHRSDAPKPKAPTLRITSAFTVADKKSDTLERPSSYAKE